MRHPRPFGFDLIATWNLYWRRQEYQSGRSVVMSILFAGLSALCYGAADYTGGRATRQSPVFAVLILSQFAGLIGILVVAPFVPGATIRFSDMLWGAAAGASGVLGLALLYRALATTVAAVASPAAALVGAAAPVVAGALMGEQPGLLGWIGIGVAIPAVLLLTAERRSGESSKPALLLGVLAGLGFGGF
ncbi:MAG: EamA family transporter, partial [Spirochaetaceae bacterium]|nr:EamA family transporter [Spirochaetaceae bacterium]